MKKKVSFVAVLAAAILVIGATVAVAEMLGINVLEFFGEYVGRYEEIAPYAVLDETSEVSVTSVELGTTVASISDAYYDGQSLIAGFSIQNSSRMEQFTPDDTLVAKMTKVDDAPFDEIITDEEWALVYQWCQALTDGVPMGIITYKVYPSDHTTTDDGVDIPPFIWYEKREEDGTVYTIREFAAPLPEELRNLDQLTLNIRLYQGISYFYFDGTDTYTYYDRQVVPEPMKATVVRTDAEFNTFMGSDQCNGLQYEVTAHASAVNTQMEMTFETDSLPTLDNGQWYEFYLTNENDEVLSLNQCDDSETGRVRMTFEGTGTAPVELTLRIYVAHEGDFDRETAVSEARPVVLTRKK